ncbi:hypothetical protein SDC9_140186 [bioreactor metagenome]|uniref:Uncharacterized protein n=1 Tax=bioreactor metagenome TaxID=1076179 RepID=A0A645DU82_9ZZZZ
MFSELRSGAYTASSLWRISFSLLGSSLKIPVFNREIVILVPLSSGFDFGFLIIGASYVPSSCNLIKSIFMPTQSASPRLVDIIVVTSPSLAVAILKPTPNNPRFPIGSLLVYPALTAFCSLSIGMPHALSMTSIVLSDAETESDVQLTVILLSASSGAVALTERKASIELSTNSAIHCHVWKGISPRVRSILGVGEISTVFNLLMLLYPLYSV